MHPLAGAYTLAMATVVLDPAVLRRWQLLQSLADGLRSVEVLRVADSDRRLAVPSHQHAVPTLAACLAGVVRIRHGGGDRDLRPGEALVIAPGAWHHHAQVRPGSAWFGQGLIRGRSDVALAEVDWSLWASVPEQPARGMLEELVATGDAALRLRLLRDLLAADLSVPWEARPLPLAAQRMGEALWRHLDRPGGAAAILRASGLGLRQAHRVFVAAFGDTPKRELQRQKLTLAAARLAEGAAVGAAALAAGYGDRRAFSRAWRRQHGTPPRKARITR